MSSHSQINLGDRLNDLPAGDLSQAPASDGYVNWVDALRFFTLARVLKFVILAGLFFLLFHGPLVRQFLVWWEPNSNWSHGLLIPLFVIGIFLAIHPRWQHVPLRPTYWGLGLILLTMLFYIGAIWWWQAIMLQDYSWWLVIVAMVLTLCGWRFTLAIWFPLAFILFGIRVAGVIYDPLAQQLQRTAATASTALLQLMQIHTERSGNVIELFTRSGGTESLEVAEACSGMRILMAFAALGALMAYMARKPLWHRIALVVAIVPIAIACNVVRVAGMGVLHYFDKKEWAQDFAHTLEGMLMLPLAFLMFWGLHAFLSRLFVETEHDDADPADSPDSPADPASAAAAAPTLTGRLGDARRWLFGDRADAAWSAQIGHARGQIARALRRALPSLRERHFVALAGLMLVLGLGWMQLSQTLPHAFRKQPVALRQTLDHLPRVIPCKNGADDLYWVAEAQPAELLDPQVEKSLNAKHPYRLRGGDKDVPEDPKLGDADDPKLLLTSQYVQRFYFKRKKMRLPGGMESFDDKVAREDIAYFFVSFYTNTADPVPHVPDRCYLGSGYLETDRQDLTVQVNGQTLPLRRMQFVKGDNVTNVAYMFNFNWRWSSEHLKVRSVLGNPLGKYSYFAKIEVKFPYEKDPQRSVERTRELLEDVLPTLVNEIFPDPDQYPDR